ncbi:hypothetical protein SAMN04488120_10867 [Fontimonas thermophila]|uniref:Uncharacterized protein n=1 Tax=Fontimonas thermophila TaxID=1076937 RepID=A0A1I2JJT0_9GAMM|nr:hypothetical protein [Fontimonas thermophila]SFF55102.1 hypothetical protein SAMN04488120_10867 [Fontimonas thermophila]
MKQCLLSSILLGSVVASTAHAHPGADSFLGASLGHAQVAGGTAGGDSQGYKFFLGSQGRLFGGELGCVNVAELGGGPNQRQSPGRGPQDVRPQRRHLSLTP